MLSIYSYSHSISLQMNDDVVVPPGVSLIGLFCFALQKSHTCADEVSIPLHLYFMKYSLSRSFQQTCMPDNIYLWIILLRFRICLIMFPSKMRQRGLASQQDGSITLLSVVVFAACGQRYYESFRRYPEVSVRCIWMWAESDATLAYLVRGKYTTYDAHHGSDVSRQTRSVDTQI